MSWFPEETSDVPPKGVTDRDITLIATIRRKLESVDHDVRMMRRSINAALQSRTPRGNAHVRSMRRL